MFQPIGTYTLGILSYLRNIIQVFKYQPIVAKIMVIVFARNKRNENKNHGRGQHGRWTKM